MTTAKRIGGTEAAASVRELVALGLRLDTVGAAKRKTVGVDVEDSAAAAKLVIDGTKVDLLDLELAKERGTHDARLNSDIEIALLEDFFGDTHDRGNLLAVRIVGALSAILVAFVRGAPLLRVGRVVLLALWHLGGHLGSEASGGGSSRGRDIHEGRNGHQLGMASAVATGVGRVHASGDDLAFVDKDAADRSFVGPKREASLRVIVSSRLKKEDKDESHHVQGFTHETIVQSTLGEHGWINRVHIGDDLDVNLLRWRFKLVDDSSRDSWGDADAGQLARELLELVATRLLVFLLLSLVDRSGRESDEPGQFATKLLVFRLLSLVDRSVRERHEPGQTRLLAYRLLSLVDRRRRWEHDAGLFGTRLLVFFLLALSRNSDNGSSSGEFGGVRDDGVHQLVDIHQVVVVSTLLLKGA